MVEVLGPLSSRPPTPPRTTSRVLSNKDRTEDSPLIIHTPTESPFTAHDSAGAPSSRQSKRVNFSPWMNYIKPPSFANSSAKSKVPTPSNDSKPTKSILKTSNTNIPTTESPGPQSLAMFLESLTQQLAGESITSRVDAYEQFFNTLRAYEDLPRENEFLGKVGLFTQFIQRDINRDLTNCTPSDTNLLIQALKLGVILVWHHQSSTHIPDDFRIFLVDHCIARLEDPTKVPKSILVHYMSVLSTQKFHARIMTNARTTRILNVLHELTNKVKGTRIVQQRLAIYECILQQSKSVFVAHSTSWMDHLISGLLHHVGDIRSKAIILGQNIHLTFGPNVAISKTTRDIFDRPLDNGGKLALEIRERMTRMMGTSESGLHVPQIWGVITMLLRSKRFNIDQWEHFKEWVLVLQKGFNCTDARVKSHAICGWNRFVLVVNPSETASRSLLRLLSKPILSQFDRKRHEKNGSQPSQLAVSSYFNLLYHAFRPSVSDHQLDILWTEYIGSPSSSIFSSVTSLSDRVAHALSNMLWSAQPKVWTENRVSELNNKLTPEELPTIDCKWLRLRIPAVLKVFEDLFKSSVWDADIEKSNIAMAWFSLSKALSYASSKEITPSPESMQAVAHVLGLFQRLWKAGPTSLNAAENGSMDAFFERFRFLSTTMIVALGRIPFTEKLLLKTADATYQAATTPTHRHQKANNDLDSPILHLLRLVSDVSGLAEPTPSYLRLIHSTLETVCNGRVSRGSRLELLRLCADIYPNEDEYYLEGHAFAQIVWKSTAQLSADALCSIPIESARERDGSVSRDYENVITILSTGLKFAGISPEWDQLIGALIRVLRTEKGDQIIATTVVEPLAQIMTRLNVRNIYLPTASLFNHSLAIPFSESVTSENQTKNSDSDLRGSEPFFPQKLSDLASRILCEAYEGFDSTEINSVAGFIESLTSFLGSGATKFRTTLLDNLQEPLALYLKDEARKLTVESGVESRILTACRALSSSVLNILQGALPHDASSLHRFERIICAGLGSSHISIAKRFIDFWSTTFGTQNNLRYSDTVALALQNLEAQIAMKTSGSPSPEGSQRQTRPLAPGRATMRLEDPSVKSRIAFILDEPIQSSYAARLNSSPVTKGHEPINTPSEPLQESSNPQHSEVKNIENPSISRDHSVPLPTRTADTTRHGEVLLMIDSLRSSSPPTNTPRELGFLTPLRLRSPTSDAETPQTPTLPPVPGDTEDGFLGSSPTPGIRCRTQSAGTEVSTSLSTGMDIDPPSSPPDLNLGSPERRQRSKSPDTPVVREKSGKNKKKKAKSKRASRQENKKTTSSQSKLGSQASLRDENGKEQAVKSGLRSSLRTSSGFLKVEETHKSSTQTHNYESNSAKSPSKGNQPHKGPNRVDYQSQEPEPEPFDCIADSFSDDMNTQVTSQLEQDLVFAVDLDSPATDAPAIEIPQGAPVTRKRKREEEAARSRKDRRRSSRLSSVTTPATPDTGNTRMSRSKKQKVNEITENTQSTPVGSAIQKRRGTPASANASSLKYGHGATRDNKASDTQESSQKRRSSRISGVAAPEIPAEVPTPRKSPHSGRSRKQIKKQRDSSRLNPQSETAEVSRETNVAESEASNLSQVSRPREPSAEAGNSRQLFQGGSTEPSQEPAQPVPPLTATTTIADEDDHDHDVHMTDAEMRTDHDISLSSRTKTTRSETSKTTEAKPQTADPKETGITASLRRLVDDVKMASLDRNTVKEIDNILFDLRFEMHEALRRHSSGSSKSGSEP